MDGFSGVVGEVFSAGFRGAKAVAGAAEASGAGGTGGARAGNSAGKIDFLGGSHAEILILTKLTIDGPNLEIIGEYDEVQRRSR